MLSCTSLLSASRTPWSLNGSMPCLASLASSPLANVHALTIDRRIAIDANVVDAVIVV